MSHLILIDQFTEFLSELFHRLDLCLDVFRDLKANKLDHALDLSYCLDLRAHEVYFSKLFLIFLVLLSFFLLLLLTFLLSVLG